MFDLNKKKFSYDIACNNLKIGDIVHKGKNKDLSLGSSLLLKNIPAGSFVFNVNTKPGNKKTLSRSAGAYAILKLKFNRNAVLELNSGEEKTISLNCFGTLGEVSNEFFYLRQLGKAGYSRWLNIRPSVRGVAMNPVDHPNGGGEGKQSGKNKTPWGKPDKKGVKKKK